MINKNNSKLLKKIETIYNNHISFKFLNLKIDKLKDLLETRTSENAIIKGFNIFIRNPEDLQSNYKYRELIIDFELRPYLKRYVLSKKLLNPNNPVKSFEVNEKDIYTAKKTLNYLKTPMDNHIALANLEENIDRYLNGQQNKYIKKEDLINIGVKINSKLNNQVYKKEHFKGKLLIDLKTIYKISRRDQIKGWMIYKKHSLDDVHGFDCL